MEPKLASTQRFREQLETQLGFLRKSCTAYDSGDHTEAIRLAGTLRTLLHNGEGRSRDISLLRHLGVQDDLWFVDTGIYRDKFDAALNAVAPEGMIAASYSPSETGLIELRPTKNGRSEWAAILREHRFHPRDPRAKAMVGQSRFEEWWTTELIEASDRNKSFSRRDLVKTIADQDGYAHVDAEIVKYYEAFCTDSMGRQFVMSDSPIHLLEPFPDNSHVHGNPAAASIRQIAFEVLLTVERFLMSKHGRFYTINGQKLTKLTQPPENYNPIERHMANMMPMIFARPA